MWAALVGREMWLILEGCTAGDGADMRPGVVGPSDFFIVSSDACWGNAGGSGKSMEQIRFESRGLEDIWFSWGGDGRDEA